MLLGLGTFQVRSKWRCGRVFASQAKGREFDPRLPLQTALKLEPGVPLGFSFEAFTPMFTPIESDCGSFLAPFHQFGGTDLSHCPPARDPQQQSHLRQP